jgi:hypothetical protein
MMLRNARFEVVGMPGIIRPVIAAQKVGVESHYPDQPLVRILRQAQDERAI